MKSRAAIAVLACTMLTCRPMEIVPPRIEAALQYDVADLILLVERVHRLDDRVPDGTAIAIRGSRILGISSHDAILRYRGAATKIERFLGAHVYPGLTDAHGHLAGLGDAGIDLRGLANYGALVDRVRTYAARLPSGTWILGRGWDQNRWPNPVMPDHAELSAATPDHPVYLTRVDGHAALANAEALRRAGVDLATETPEGGRILRRADGSASGVLVDNAMALVTRRLAPPTMSELQRRLLEAQHKCFEVGLTRVHDAGVSGPARRLMRELETNGKWKLGVYGMLPSPSASTALPVVDDPGPRARLRFRAVKLYADGALGSSLAALEEDYSDESGNRGQLTTSESDLRARIEWCRDKGYQPCVHAIGDRANRIVLDAFEALLSPQDRRSLRPRIEHAQVLASDDLPRFARLGVVASVQPTHLTSDMPWAPRRLGSSRIAGAYAFRTLLEDGARVCFGSDFPVEPHNPVEGLFAAITTRPPDAPELAPLREDQALSRRRALEGFTSGPAYAAFEEGVRGRLSIGFEADMTILDRDLLADDIPVRAYLGTKVLATIVAGEIVWRR